MQILIKSVRIYGFRGLQNVEIELEPITVLTGMNNSGKTSFLKALQVALGNRSFISQDDFFASDKDSVDEIIIDLKIISVDGDGNQLVTFSENWEVLFTEERIVHESGQEAYLPLRTVVTFDELNNAYKAQQFILNEWPDFSIKGKHFWYESYNGKKRNFRFDEIPFFYMDAQRDIIEDIKNRASYLGKMISKIKYSPQDIEDIEDQIKILNEKAVSSSSVLSNIKTTLKELGTALDSHSEGVDITPFTKKIRDLNKGFSIYYTDNKGSFPMEYHGMGTRSWSSLLTLKSFISILDASYREKGEAFFPIIAIEEPEAHLYPNAQKKLYQQISKIGGQKIISTHSPCIAALAKLEEVRNFYNNGSGLLCGQINVEELDSEDKRKIKWKVINSRGEIFFSKAIVLFEGETEEQALPVFADHYFGKTAFEIGVDFVGVGGYGNYLPFIRFAHALAIPWCIFSDAEPETVKSVKKQIKSSLSNERENEVVVFLDDGNNFERQLIDDGYTKEIKDAIKNKELSKCKTKQHAKAKQAEIDSYDNKELYETISEIKTQYGAVIAEEIIKSGKQLPPKIEVLFKKIEKMFKGEKG
ncbi:MAG: AAA family ATPase [Candidatus Saelkia tenebricola]|nr:AAA family ATPase [Candidatus Saelkia tenebricola]